MIDNANKLHELLKNTNKFEQHFKSLFQDNYERFLASLQGKPSISVRTNNFKPIKDLFTGNELVKWQENAFYLKERPSFVADPLHHAGAYYVQEASSMFFSNAIPFKPGMLVLDLCAAPGGKSTLLLNHLSEDSLLITNELDFKRMKVLLENITRWGSRNTVVSNNSSSAFVKWGVQFDLVLVDAPCSGEGMFRKDPRTLEQWSEKFVETCASTQKDILKDAVQLVKPGGHLVYSTCTYEPCENEEQLQTTLSEMPYKWTGVKVDLQPDWGLVEKEFQIADKQMFGYYLYHFLTKGEGQFISVLQKEHDPSFKVKNKVSKSSYLPKLIPALQSEWSHLDLDNIILFKDFYHYLPKEWHGLLPQLEKLQLWKLGTKLGQLIHGKFIPHHEMAMAKLYDENQTKPIELNKTQALKYLKKEAFDLEDKRLGFLPVSYKGLPLGWIKNLGTRFNNYFPIEFKIRKDLEF